MDYRGSLSMMFALKGPKGPNKWLYVPIMYNALCISGVILAAAVSDEAVSSLRSPRARFEQMVRGAPITESSSSLIEEMEASGDPEPQLLREMSPADRFRLIVLAETHREDTPVQIESSGVLHPIKTARMRRKAPHRGGLATLAVGMVPAAALFSQVVLGSRMKASVLEDMSDAVDFAEPAAYAKGRMSRADRVTAAMTSKTAIGISAVLASLAAIYLFKQGVNRWRKSRKVGLLTPSTAKWELNQCLLILDIHGAQETGAIRGKYVAGSASLKVDVHTQRATLTYTRIPAFSSSPLRSLMRKVDTVTEHFYLPADRCFVSAEGATETQKFDGLPHSFIQEYVEKSRFRRERVAALTVHAERSPGLQALHQAATPPGPPPLDLLDAIRLKRQTTGKNMVEVEDSPTVRGKDAALASLEDLVGNDFCGGTILCVDSVSIAGNKNLCIVHAAVEDARPISVLADVSLQALSILVGETNKDATDDGAQQTPAADYVISLPRHCALADASHASYTVAPFSMDAESELSTEVFAEPLEGPLRESTGEAEEDTVSEEPEVLPTDKDSAVAGVDLDDADDVLSDATGAEEKTVKLAANTDRSSSSSKRVHYQHVRIQFKPLYLSKQTVSLKLLPHKQLRA